MISAVLVVAAVCLFLYPAWTVVRVLTDDGMINGGVPRVVVSRFGALSGRYHEWGRWYLDSQHAATVHYMNVPATEWPMFGSVMYLLAAQEMVKQPGFTNSTAFGRVLDAAHTAALVITNPVTATWVKQKWGAAYLTEKNLFYRNLIIMGLAAYEDVTGDRAHRPLLEAQTKSLAAELEAAPFHVLEDYPGECYPCDVLWAVAGINRADKLLGTSHATLVSNFMATMTTRFLTPGRLPAYMADPATGEIHGLARGSLTSGLLIFAPELDRPISREWYPTYDRGYWHSGRLFAGFREHAADDPDQFEDADSGIIVNGYGSVATAIGIGAARAHGRFDRSVPMTGEAIACSWPTPYGSVIPGMLGWVAANGACLGDVLLAFSMTRPAVTGDVVPSKGGTPGIVWIMLGVYAVGGVVLLAAALRMAHRAGEAVRQTR